MYTKLKLNEAGYHLLPFILVIAFICTAAYAGMRILDSKNTDRKQVTIDRENPTPNRLDFVNWEMHEGEWKASGGITPPECPEPFEIKSPVDLNRVPSVMYPGQVRGGDYKPHGGFRILSETGPDVNVVAPFDAYLTDGSRYFEMGAQQYLLTFVHPCGMAYRFDHLFTLSPELQKYGDQLPEPKADDSRTTKFQQLPFIKQGTVIATKVGVGKADNIGFDFGVYDYRQRNEASKDPAYASKHQSEASQAFHAVCWLKLLSPAADSEKILSLPGDDFYQGKTSDYCS